MVKNILKYEELIIGNTYKITEIIRHQKVNKGAYCTFSGKTKNTYEAILIAKDDETLCLTFDLGNGVEKDIFHDFIGTKKSGAQKIESI